jgi:hypothetical protein
MPVTERGVKVLGEEEALKNKTGGLFNPPASHIIFETQITTHEFFSRERDTFYLRVLRRKQYTMRRCFQRDR